MAQHQESAFQKRCKARLDELGVYTINKYGDGRTAYGAPDLLCCINGLFVAFELKVGKNGLSDAQKIHRTRILKSGGVHFAPRSDAEFEANLMEVMNIERKSKVKR